MRKYSKVLIVTMALALVLAFMPAATFADTTTAPVTAKVTCTASTPNGFDMVNKTLTVSSDLAETYLGVTEATTTKVTFLDVLVAAHIAKYGSAFTKDTAANYLVVTKGWASKQFGHSIVGLYYINNVAIANGLSTDTVKDGDAVKVCSYLDNDKSYKALFSHFVDNESYTAKAGKTFYVTLNAYNGDSSLVPNTCKMYRVNKTTGAMTLMSGRTDDHGIASVKFNTLGTHYISALGTVTYKNWEGKKTNGAIMAPLAKVKVGLSAPKAKASNKTATSVKITWGKVTAASKYNVYRATSKTGTYKCVKTTTGTSFTNKGLKNGKHYYYKVKAVKGTYVSSYSKAVVK